MVKRVSLAKQCQIYECRDRFQYLIQYLHQGEVLPTGFCYSIKVCGTHKQKIIYVGMFPFQGLSVERVRA